MEKALEGLYEKYIQLYGKKERWRLGGSFGDALKAGNIDDAMAHADDTNKQRLKVLVSNYYQYGEAEYQGKKVELNKPFRTPNDSKKFAVYVENNKGNVIIVRFGDSDMEIKRDDPERRKAFRSRHNCDEATDKTTASYWSCKMWSDKNVSDLTEADPCWDGYTQYGMKEKNGKKVPNCVKESYKDFLLGESLNEKYYSEEDESSGANSESPSLPFTLKRYIKDPTSVSQQVPTELRGITTNLQQAQDSDYMKAKEDVTAPAFFRTMGKYVYVESGKYSKYKEKKGEHICEKLKNTVWEMSDPNRPILPQEGLGITNTHPHCKCGWEIFTVMETDQSTRGRTLRPTLNGRALEDFAWKGTGVDHLGKVDKLIEDKYEQGTLHKLNDDGSVGNIMESHIKEFCAQELEKVRTCNCPAKMAGVMLGGIANESWATEGKGKKIKGILAYAGVSHNQRLYLPEVLSTGDGKTLPLIFNHATHQGIENELHRLPEDIRRQILQDQRIIVGEVKLHWKPEDLTLFYEGEIKNPFFISEVDKGDMAVSLGMIFDADSPKVCNVECYTVVKGGEFNEVSLVYHPGFPIASIEANEAYLKHQIREHGHVVYEGIGTEEMARVWENMNDLKKITLLKISGLEEKYDKSHSWEDFEADCKIKLVAAYNGESVDHAMSNSQNTNEPSEMPPNTQIEEVLTASMEYKKLSEKLDQLIEGKKRPVDKAMEAIDQLIEEASPAPPTGNYSGDLPNVLGVYPLQDKIKDITKISWDKHVLPNRKLSILSSLKNKYDVEDNSTPDTPFSKLPKKFKDDLKELGFEVRIKNDR